MNYSTIEGTSRGYKILVSLLGVMVGVFITSFLVSYLKGQQVWGVSNIIPWGQLITFYIYFIGLSAGAIIISSLSYVFKREAYEPIGRLAVLMGILLMVGAMVFVMVDLGRPEKAWRLFMYFYLNNMTSLFAINSIFYTGYITLMLIYLWLIFEGKKRLAGVVGTIDVLWAIAVHMGTGAIFGVIGNREIFFSPIKPFEFLMAALTSGTSLIILTAIATFKLTRRGIQEELVFSLSRLLTYLILILLVMVFVDKLTHLYFPNREAMVYLIAGDYWWIFWVFQIGMGIGFPLFLLIYPKTKKTLKGVVIAALSVVIGVFGERAALVIPGTAHPQPFFPGKIEGLWGEPGIFPITFWESLLSLSIVSLVVLLFVLGLRYLEILPERKLESIFISDELSIHQRDS
ncbi:MAG: NrfD/PsrC family molybdoenzyme membrane anchor subunit [Thermodesulfobacteriota bacterium]